MEQSSRTVWCLFMIQGLPIIGQDTQEGIVLYWNHNWYRDNTSLLNQKPQTPAANMHSAHHRSPWRRQRGEKRKHTSEERGLLYKLHQHAKPPAFKVSLYIWIHYQLQEENYDTCFIFFQYKKGTETNTMQRRITKSGKWKQKQGLEFAKHSSSLPWRSSPCSPMPGGRECRQARPGLTWWSPARGWALQVGSLDCPGPGKGAASPLGRRWEWGDPVLSFYCPAITGMESRVGGREKVISVWFIFYFLKKGLVVRVQEKGRHSDWGIFHNSHISKPQCCTMCCIWLCNPGKYEWDW